MGVFVGLLFGMGLFLLVSPHAVAPRRRPRGLLARTNSLLAVSGISTVTAGQLLAGTVIACVLVFAVAVAVSGAVPLGLAFALFTAMAPRAWLRRRSRGRLSARREAWPEAVDNLVSGVRAGLSLPEAVTALGVSGPAELRAPFRRFGEDHRATGAFSACLDRLAQDLADPVGDRVIEALRVAREVGGSDLGGLLRTLSKFLRDDARTRGEVEARQSWTVNAARVALAAPWLVLLLLATQSTTVRAYNSPTGALVLAIGGGISYAAFLMMRRIGRLAEEQRVLR